MRNLWLIALLVPCVLPAQEFMQNRRKAFQPVASTAFVYYSAYFDGANDYLTRGAQLTGVGDYKTGTLSVWIKALPTGAPMRVVDNNSDYFDVFINAFGQFTINLYSPPSPTLLVNMNSGGTIVTNGAWRHVLISWDTSSTNHMYIDDTAVASGSLSSGTGVDWTRSDFSVGAQTGGGSKYKGWICELALYTNYVDCTVVANRRRFRTSGGKPENLGSDGSLGTNKPVVYLKSQVPNWEVNAGTGEGLTENGTLDDGGADKP